MAGSGLQRVKGRRHTSQGAIITHEDPLREKEAILSVDSAYGIRDYFLIRAVRISSSWQIYMHDIDIDKSIEYIRAELQVDFSDRLTTALCVPGYSFREWAKQNINLNLTGYGF